MEADFQIYKTDRLTFILTPKKILVQTNHQSFFLDPGPHCSPRMRTIRRMIQAGRINNLIDLGNWCHHDIAWAHTQQRVPVDNLAQVI